MSVGAVNKQTGDRIPTAGMPAIDSVLSGTSTNPVQNRVVKAALDAKADTDIVASDFDATASYTAGNYCIYEGKFYKFKANHTGAWAAADVDEIQIAGELSSIKSGLTNVDVALSVPENTGKNVLPMTLSGIKSLNTTGTWNNNVCTINGVDYTVNTDADGNVVDITVNGTASNVVYFYIADDLQYLGTFDGSYTINGGVAGGSATSYALQAYSETSSIFINCYEPNDYIIEKAGYTDSAIKSVIIVVRSGVPVNNLVFKPMIRPATITDPTFAPYIPSVESRIETIEGGNISGLTLGKIPHTRYAFNSANTSLEITIPTYKAYFGIAHHPWAENAGDIVIINSASAGNLGCYQTSNVFTITKNGNVLTLTNGASPMYLDLYEITP